jgi:hypothetical protein
MSMWTAISWSSRFPQARSTLSLGPIAHRIATIVIGGTVAGTDVGGDHFGFSAVVIGSFKSAGFTAPPNVTLQELSLSTGDVTIRTS